MSKYLIIETKGESTVMEPASEFLLKAEQQTDVIVIREGSSGTFTEEDIKDLIVSLDPFKIIHFRRTQSIDYRTLFVGKNQSILVIGMYTSGYVGGGTGKFQRVCKALGVDDEHIEKYIRSKTKYNENALFHIVKNDLSEI